MCPVILVLHWVRVAPGGIIFPGTLAALGIGWVGTCSQRKSSGRKKRCLSTQAAWRLVAWKDVGGTARASVSSHVRGATSPKSTRWVVLIPPRDHGTQFQLIFKSTCSFGKASVFLGFDAFSDVSPNTKIKLTYFFRYRLKLIRSCNYDMSVLEPFYKCMKHYKILVILVFPMSWNIYFVLLGIISSLIIIYSQLCWKSLK